MKEKGLKQRKAPCPSQHGSITGYEVQVKRDNGEWGPANLRKVQASLGVPLPACHGGILDTLGLLGFAQANSLAWLIKAEAASAIKYIDTRIVPFDIVYDLKAWAREDEAKELQFKEET